MLDFCNHIRIGEVTAEELKLLNRRHVDTLHSMQLNDARRRVPTNARADHHNAERLETFRERSRSMIRDFGQTELPIYNVTAVDTHFDTRGNGGNCSRNLDYPRPQQMWRPIDTIRYCAWGSRYATSKYPYLLRIG